MTTERVWMTPAVLQRLQDELTGLDHATTDTEQARALELRELIRRAEVGSPPDDGLVEPGMTVTVRFERDGSETTFLLGSRDLSGLDPDVDIEVYSPTSPLGASITGRYVGDEVTFAAPSGEQRITVLAAKPFG